MLKKLPILFSLCSLIAACHSPTPLTERQAAAGHYGNSPIYEAMGKTYRILSSSHGYRKRGIASWYGPNFNGQLTATRERYDMYGFTAASPELPLPTRVRVTNLDNGRQVVVRVNDRGPFHANRIIDLSYAAAKTLHMIGPGTAHVEVAAIDDPNLPGSTPSPYKHAAIYWRTGTFSQWQNARRQQRWLAHRFPSLNIRIQHADTAHGPRYRVSIGPMQTLTGAKQLQHQLAGMGIYNTIACA